MINIGIIGVGYWGPNYVRTSFELEDVNLVWVADLNKESLEKIKKRYPSIKTTTDYNDLIKDKTLSAVIIVTPAQTHYKIAKKFLESGKDVLIEKPLTANLNESLKLKKIIEKTNKILMVDHIFKFNPTVTKLKEMIENGELGKIHYISASYTALGPIRKDVDAIWDLAPHWVYTINFLLGLKPVSVSATGGIFLKEGMNDVAFLNLEYPGNIIVNIHVSWLYPQKVRSIAIVGDKKMAILDDVSSENKLVIYDKGISYSSNDPNFANLQIILRDGDVAIRKIENKEPLKESFKHFLNCVRERKEPISGVKDGIEVVEILSKINESLRKKGKSIKL